MVLLHGLFSDANMNWIKFGHAERIAAEGFRVIMPDLRAHGQSDRPHGEAYYPKGILARDLRELIALLQLDDFDLGGFSLGARTIVEGVGEGFDRVARSLAALVSTDFAIGSGARFSSSMRSPCSTRFSAATRTGCLSSS